MIYAIIDTSELTSEKFAQLQAQGIQQTALDTVRTSLDTTKSVIKWNDADSPDLTGLTIHSQGNNGEIQSQLATAEWETISVWP